jgi:hypothetical protein
MGDGATTVGRPKKGERKAGRGSKDPNSAGAEDRETIVFVKGSSAYFDFVDDVHKKTFIPKAQLFRIAFREWCERNGHGTPPEI